MLISKRLRNKQMFLVKLQISIFDWLVVIFVALDYFGDLFTILIGRKNFAIFLFVIFLKIKIPFILKSLVSIAKKVP